MFFLSDLASFPLGNLRLGNNSKYFTIFSLKSLPATVINTFSFCIEKNSSTSSKISVAVSDNSYLSFTRPLNFNSLPSA